MTQMAGVILAHQGEVGALVGPTIPRRAIGDVRPSCISQIYRLVLGVALISLRPLLYPCRNWYGDTPVSQVLATFVIDDGVIAAVELQYGNVCTTGIARS